MKIKTLDDKYGEMMCFLKHTLPEYCPLPEEVDLELVRRSCNLGVLDIRSILEIKLGYKKRKGENIWIIK